MLMNYFFAISILIRLIYKIGGKSPSSAKKENLIRKYFVAVIFFFLIFDHSGSGISQVRLDKAESAQYVPGEVLVKFKDGTDEQAIEAIQRELCLKTIRVSPKLHVYRMKILDGSPVEEVIKHLQGFKEVEYSEPNYIVRLQ